MLASLRQGFTAESLTVRKRRIWIAIPRARPQFIGNFNFGYVTHWLVWCAFICYTRSEALSVAD